MSNTYDSSENYIDDGYIADICEWSVEEIEAEEVDWKRNYESIGWDTAATIVGKSQLDVSEIINALQTKLWESDICKFVEWEDTGTIYIYTEAWEYAFDFHITQDEDTFYATVDSLWNDLSHFWNSPKQAVDQLSLLISEHVRGEYETTYSEIWDCYSWDVKELMEAIWSTFTPIEDIVPLEIRDSEIPIWEMRMEEVNSETTVLYATLFGKVTNLWRITRKINMREKALSSIVYTFTSKVIWDIEAIWLTSDEASQSIFTQIYNKLYELSPEDFPYIEDQDESVTKKERLISWEVKWCEYTSTINKEDWTFDLHFSTDAWDFHISDISFSQKNDLAQCSIRPKDGTQKNKMLFTKKLYGKDPDLKKSIEKLLLKILNLLKRKGNKNIAPLKEQLLWYKI